MAEEKTVPTGPKGAVRVTDDDSTDGSDFGSERRPS
jgi:hypothetical protein